MLLFRADGTIIACNHSFMDRFGYDLADLTTMADWWRLSSGDPALAARSTLRHTPSMRRAFSEGMDIEASEYRVLGKGGDEFIVRMSGVAMEAA